MTCIMNLHDDVIALISEFFRFFFDISKLILTRNHMIASAIWDKQARQTKLNELVGRVRSLKNLKVLIYSKLYGKNHVITVDC